MLKAGGAVPSAGPWAPQRICVSVLPIDLRLFAARLKPCYVYSNLCMLMLILVHRYNSMNQDLIAVSSNPLVTADTGMDSLVKAFLAGRTPRTIETYRQGLEDFARYLKVETVHQAGAILLSQNQGDANRLVFEFRNSLVEAGRSAATINLRLSTLNALVKLGRLFGLVPWQLDVPQFRLSPYRDTKGPGRAGFQRLQGQADRRHDRKGIRDKAILSLLYDLALRRAEVTRLDLADLDLDAGTLAVLGKGRNTKERLTLPEPTKMELANWLRVRGHGPGPLFVNVDRSPKGNRHGRRLTGTSIYRIIRKLGTVAGIQTRPHGLRHAAITEALDLTGGNIRAVARFSRHHDLKVLMIYDDNREDLAGGVARLVADRARLERLER